MTKPFAVMKPPDDLTIIAKDHNIDRETLERAWRAVNEFRKMMPQMRAFVRAITRKPEMNVEITSGVPCTDGRTVWLRAPIALGDRIDHARAVCGQRDPDTLGHLCPAHARYEEIMTTMIHECAHIVFDSFETLRDEDRAEIITKVLFERPGISGTRLAKLQKGFEGLVNPSYVLVNNLISPYLPVIFNALEDARVNRSMYTARAGTKLWFQAQAIRVFSEGIEREDGTVHKWSEMGMNSQIVIGLYCRASGFKTEGWFADEVEEALSDPQLANEIMKITMARSAASVYRAGFPILEHLRRLGYCKRLGEPEDDPPPPPAPKGDEEGEGGSGGDTYQSGGGGKSSKDEEENEPQKGRGAIVPEEDGSGGAVAPEDMFDSEPSVDDDDGSEPSADDDDKAAGDVPQDDDEGDEDADENQDDSGDEESDDDDESDEGAKDGNTLDDDESESGCDGFGTAKDTKSDSEKEDENESGEGDGDGDDAKPDETPDDVGAALAKFGGHGERPITRQEKTEADAIDRAVVQGEDFDRPSGNVLGVNVHKWDEKTRRSMQLCWKNDSYYGSHDVTPSEQILGKSLLVMRTTFAFNKASRRQTGLRHGRLHTPHAARTAVGDKEVFARTRIPGRRNYKVIVGLDCSGSTVGRRNVIIRQAGMAMSELLHRTGVGFAVYGHTGYYSAAQGGTGALIYDVDQFECKSFAQPWGPSQKDALCGLMGAQCNLDGHSLQFYRKQIQAEQATDKLIIYFSDGQMPAENYEDELEVLQAEIEMCRKLNIALLGVGINCDSPKQHGLDTVRIDSVEDIPALVKEIESRLAKVQV